MLQFAGYEDTPDEIYEIEDIRNYVMDMFHRWSEMFYCKLLFTYNTHKCLACEGTTRR